MTDSEQHTRPTAARFSSSVSVVDNRDSEESPRQYVLDDSSPKHNNNDETENKKANDRSQQRFVSPKWLKKIYHDQLGWIPPKLNVRALKPVVRSAICAWVSNHPSYHATGQDI